MTGPIMPKGKGSGGSAVMVETVRSQVASSKSKQGSNQAKQQNQNPKNQQGANNNNNRKRTNSGPGKKQGHDNNPNQKKQQGAAGAGPSSLLQNNNSRYGRGGRNFSGPPNPPPDLLTPTVPPLYPSASAPVSLKTSSLDKVKRFTDMYKAPLTVNSDIVHKVHPLRIPGELSSNSPFKKPSKPKTASSKITVVDLDDEEEKPAEGGADKKKTNEEDGEQPPEIIEEEEMEDGDDELDMGTDYVSSYFDNGEGFLDSDDDGGDDGAIY